MVRLLTLFLFIFLSLSAASTLSSISSSQAVEESKSISAEDSKIVDIEATTLPFNYAGLLLILLGIAFMVAEVFIAGFGIFGIGGVIAFAFGSLLLFDADVMGSEVSIPLIVAFTIISLSFFILVIKLFLNSKSAKVVTGAEEMIGAAAEVIDSVENGYIVRCHGEVWSATSQSELFVGQRVEVIELSGLVLKVKPIKE